MKKFDYNHSDLSKTDYELDQLTKARRQLRELLVMHKDVKTVEYHCPIDI